MIEALTLYWLLPCALQDWQRRTVSNRLTLPAIPLALILRLAGWTRTPWVLILLVAAAALLLWRFGQLGGADAKAWLVFPLLGERVLLGAALGLLVWYPLARRLGLSARGRVPGYPGYAVGVALALLWAICGGYACPLQ